MPDSFFPVSPLMNGETLLSFSAVAAKLPGHRGNGHVNASTIFRWATKGMRTADGTLVRLEAVRLGASWKTSLGAVARFSAKLTAASLPDDAPQSPTPTPRQQDRAAARASKRAAAIFGSA